MKFSIIKFSNHFIYSTALPNYMCHIQDGPSHMKNLVKINAEACHKDLFNEVVNYFEVEYVPGGCTLNTLRICQWMSLSESVAVFSGAIGNDNFGEILARTIERQKVKAHLVKGLFILTVASYFFQKLKWTNNTIVNSFYAARFLWSLLIDDSLNEHIKVPDQATGKAVSLITKGLGILII